MPLELAVMVVVAALVALVVTGFVLGNRKPG
jgi:uncharacterized protein YneF (UPF0154 family)